MILIGPPGSGKGTQAQRLEQRIGAVHLSTGELLRDEIAAESPLGKTAATYMNAGRLVPDQVAVKVVVDHMDRGDPDADYILDGFPRTTIQAEELDRILGERGLEVGKAVEIYIEDDVLKERLTGRFACVKCSEGYHKSFKRPEIENVCDKCGSMEFDVRSDDTEETIRTRLGIYHVETAPILPYYENRGLLVKVDGEKSVSDVTKEIELILADVG
jgi:adenylate kinase